MTATILLLYSGADAEHSANVLRTTTRRRPSSSSCLALPRHTYHNNCSFSAGVGSVGSVDLLRRHAP
ncbi:hypothetical protein TWF569_002534 [Orbilia oligospora]|nr:hypothetical protein TWF103_011447 [Orbilia oligospora]KAF3121664.1 hypothetical protein TWF569_002534 [Orbilia oligospora]KAF3143942.1 hypothetical protein TWF594_005009 [Orbilia oligospora]